ncbi:hypothetical protein BCR36DRAFT_290124, partial [Piromyces finnis]
NEEDNDGYLIDIIKKFNIESEKNNWDIQLISKPYSSSNNVEDYNLYLEKSFKNKNVDIDLFIFNHVYLKHYSNYLQNLRLYFSYEHLNSYLTETGKQTNIYNSHIYSFVNIYLSFIIIIIIIIIIID